nr:tail fiber protein [Escherichia coli]
MMPVSRNRCIFLNVGLGEGAPAIGVPFFWPSAAMPNTVIDSWSSMVFLKFNGAKFSATDYPVLAKVFPALALPDARGEFPRIWDDGRGVDAGRTLLSFQSDDFKAHGHNFESWPDSGNPASKGGAVDARGGNGNRYITSGVVKETGGTETRPRNIAFNFLVRAK